MMRMYAFGLAVFLVLAAGSAAAKPWTIDYAHSKLGFTGMQGNATFDGQFKTFTAIVDFDPAHPDAGKITATIDMASATTGDADRDAALPGADWFDVADFPTAHFVSTYIDQTGFHSYEAQGLLTIKGITKPIVLNFMLTPQGKDWQINGRASLIRNEFDVGEGRWGSNDVVAYSVDVAVHLLANPGS